MKKESGYDGFEPMLLDKIRSEAGRSHEFGWSSQTPTFLQPRHLQSPFASYLT